MESLLSLAQVEQVTTLKKSTLYAHIRAGKFPAPLELRDVRATRWLASEVERWVADQIAKAREADTAEARAAKSRQMASVRASRRSEQAAA